MLQSVLFRSDDWAGRALGLVFGAIAVLGHAPFHFWPIALLSLACLFARPAQPSLRNKTLCSIMSLRQAAFRQNLDPVALLASPNLFGGYL